MYRRQNPHPKKARTTSRSEHVILAGKQNHSRQHAGLDGELVENGQAAITHNLPEDVPKHEALADPTPTDPTSETLKHDIIVVGASAGGVEALTTFVAQLPANLQAALFVVLHVPAHVPSALPQILSHAGPLPANMAVDNEPIRSGSIYVAPPDFHLLLTPKAIRITHGPQENWHRPAIDPLFRTAALAFGERVIGIVLSGARNDGTAGLIAIKRRGGLALVQDPTTAVFSSMPQSACKYVAVDYCLPVTELAKKVIELAGVTVRPQERHYSEPIDMDKDIDTDLDKDMDLEAKLAGLDPTVLDNDTHIGTITELTCPQCHGPLWEIQDGKLLRFRCRVGHAFTAEALMEGQSETVERNLWMVLNSLEESAQLYSRLALSAHKHEAPSATGLDEKVQRAQDRVRVIREILFPTNEGHQASLISPDQPGVADWQ